jgi:hypothetical protein
MFWKNVVFSFISFFIGDRERFSLPDDMPVMHFEYTQFYYPGNMEFPREYPIIILIPHGTHIMLRDSLTQIPWKKTVTDFG